MVNINTKHIRIMNKGLFDKLREKIKGQFFKKHGLNLADKDLCETIAKAVEDNKLFG